MINIAIFETTSLSLLIILIFCHFIISLNLVVCYYLFGLTIYRHSIPKNFLFVIIILYFSCSLTFLFDLLLKSNNNLPTSSFYELFILIFSVSIFFSYALLGKIRNESSWKEKARLKNKIYFFLNKFENSD